MKKKLLSILALLCLTVTSAWAETTVTFTASDLADGSSITKDGVTLTSYGQYGINMNGVNGPGEFTNSLGGNFTQIVVTADGLPSGDGWSAGTWTGSASSVSFTGNIDTWGNEFSIVCTLETTTVVASGDCGTGVTYSLTSDGTLTISGTGAMEDYTVSNQSQRPWYSSASSITSVVVETGVTHIGNHAFRGFTNMTTVTLPDGLETIGANAFVSCSGLTSVEFPASVTSIGNNAFVGCTNLTTVTLNGNPFIGTNAFASANVTMNLTANGPVDEKYWMTFFNNRYNFVADENTQVFKAELSGTSITLHEVTDKIVNSNTAVVLKSTGNPVMTKTTTSSDNSDTNSLSGVVSSEGMTAPDPSTIYVLNYTAANGVGFYKLAGGNTLEAYKAYLLYDGGGAGARAFIGFGEATGIEGVSVNENFENGEVYDLQGRRVVNPTKGLYIVNGKKVFINK